MKKVELRLNEMNKYRSGCKNAFFHGNRERKPKHSISDEIKSDIIDFYSTKYYDETFKHFSDFLEKHENIIISDTSISKILSESNIISPKSTDY